VQALPPIRSEPSVTRVLRVCGNAEILGLARNWADQFITTREGVRIDLQLDGSDVGMAALAVGVADVALLGREAAAQEMKAFEWIYRYRPARIEIMTGHRQPGGSPALAFHVHPDNPLAHISLAQADAIFSPQRLRGAGAPIAIWGDLGLAGEWAARPIRLYAPDTESGTGRFFREVVLGGGRKLYWDRLKEFADTATSDHPNLDAAFKVLAALSSDRFGSPHLCLFQSFTQ